MACEYCKDAYVHRPFKDTSGQRPALRIVGKEMAFYPYMDGGKIKQHIHYTANYCWNCGERLGDTNE